MNQNAKYETKIQKFLTNRISRFMNCIWIYIAQTTIIRNRLDEINTRDDNLKFLDNSEIVHTNQQEK